VGTSYIIWKELHFLILAAWRGVFTIGSRRELPIKDPLIREDYGDNGGSNNSGSNNSSSNKSNNNSTGILFHTSNGEGEIVIQPQQIRM
jgi:hypothetical protein